MALPSSGAISLSQVNTELGFSSSTEINLARSDVRTLFDESSGDIAMSDGRGAVRSYTDEYLLVVGGGGGGFYMGGGGAGGYRDACRPLQLAQFLSLLLLVQAVRVLLVSTPPVATAAHPLLLVKAQSVVVAEASRAVTGESVVQVAVLVQMV